MSDNVEGSVDPSAAVPDVKSLFSKTKKKIKASTVQSIPPPPPPPPPRIDTDLQVSRDEGWEREFQKLDSYLSERGFRIERVDADGSCLFSSFSVHIPTSTSLELRTEAVRHMLSHPDDFEPFIDSEAYPGGFKDYCTRMLASSTWGSQLELQALSQTRQVNVVVFQTGDKARIDMVNFSPSTAPCVTISYHDGEHYNTVVQNEGEPSAVTYEDLLKRLNPPADAVTDVPLEQLPKIKLKKKSSLFN